MEKLKETVNNDKAFDWEKVYELPYYYLVNNPYHFLEIAAWAKQHPIGVLREHCGSGWYVLFKFSREIKYVGKYPEWFMDFTDKDWDELRSSLSPKDSVYYGLLIEETAKTIRMERETQ
jgi:hypothetical protein